MGWPWLGCPALPPGPGLPGCWRCCWAADWPGCCCPLPGCPGLLLDAEERPSPGPGPARLARLECGGSPGWVTAVCRTGFFWSPKPGSLESMV